MKKASSSYLVPSAALGCLVLQIVYSNLLSSSDHRVEEHPFTCNSNKSAVIDSFGDPCVNISSFARNQVIYSYRSPQLSYLYCGIPKNGCTYHIAIMHRLMGHPYEGGANVHNPRNKNRVRPGDEISNMLLNGIRAYAVIRNPMKRVLSGYLNKVERFYTDDSLKTPHTFRKWVYKTLQPGMTWQGVNGHWKAQVEFCGFKIRDLSSYFSLFRVEKPEEYLAYMEEFIPHSVLKDGWDMPLNKSFREHVLGPRTRTENTTLKFFEYIGNAELFDYLRRVYIEDIVAFDYEDEVEEMRRNLIERVG